MHARVWLAAASVVLALAGVASAQLGDSSFDQIDHPAIQYTTRPTRDPAAALNRRLETGELQLSFDARYGYLPSLLKALGIPVESQLVVFSKTSTQFNLINPQNPRTLYFNDSVAVGSMRGGFVLEVASEDPEQGTIFYDLDQQQRERPTLRRSRACLRCHHSLYTNGVPGLLVRSTPTAADGTALPWTRNAATDHATPFDQRWGGWYVTGKTSGFSHKGNVFATDPATPAAERSQELDTLESRFDTNAYLSPYSDVVALLVLEHQAHLTNLLTRLGWETRAAAFDPKAVGSKFSFDAAVTGIADYLLFIDEAPLPGKIQGTSGFAEQFANRGPFDEQGRSLRQFDLERRMMRYPCSYMIYAPVFDQLPARARDAIYKRMWDILSGTERAGKYARLSDSDRVAILQILRETKKGLPEYFKAKG